MYLYGFTTYSFQMADLEVSLEGHAAYAAVFFATATVALVLFRRRSPAPSSVQFVDGEPRIQTINAI